MLYFLVCYIYVVSMCSYPVNAFVKYKQSFVPPVIIFIVEHA
jgi:hypothetical protein